MNKYLTIAAVLLTGCASSTGVLKMGPDTYTVSASASRVRGAETGAREMSLRAAAAHCDELGKEILVTNISGRPVGVGGRSDVTFRCLSSGDPDLQRPVYENPADVVIEQR